MKKNSPQSPSDSTKLTSADMESKRQIQRPRSAELGRRIKEKIAQIDWSSLEEISRGAQGVVYRAVVLNPDPGTSPMRIQRLPVALKLLHTKHRGAAKSFGPYATLTQALESTAQHHITHLIARVRHHKNLYAVMPLLDKSIYDLLPFFHHIKDDHLTAYSFLVMSVMLDVLVALDYTHKNNLGHRDIKPENVLWYPEIGHFVVTDMDSLARMKRAKDFHGTLGFTHPAAFSGQEAHPLPSDDIYSLGHVLKCLLTPGMLESIRDPVEYAPEPGAYIFAQMQAYQVAQKDFPQPDERAHSPLMTRNIEGTTELRNPGEMIVHNINVIANRMTALNMERIPTVDELQIVFTQLKEDLLRIDPTLSTRLDQIKMNMSCFQPRMSPSPDEDEDQSKSSTSTSTSTSSPFSPISPVYPLPTAAHTARGKNSPLFFRDPKTDDKQNAQNSSEANSKKLSNQ